MLEMNTLYPDCAPGRKHTFTVSRPPIGMFGNAFTYCTGCGMTPKQLLDIRLQWDKAGITKEGKKQ